MEQDIITSHGMAPIITRGRLPGGLEFTIIRGQAGVSPLELELVGVFILTEGDIGAQEDITEDTAMDIIMVTGMVIIVDMHKVQGQVMPPGPETRTEMFIIIVIQELNKPGMSEMRRHQII